MQLNLNYLAWQSAFLQSPAKIKALSGASDTGKSWICRLALILQCLAEPGSYHFVTAVTHTQTFRAIIEPMIQFLEENNLFHFAKYHESKGILQFFNGSRIEVFSADKMYNRLKSREFASGFIEEATTIDDKHVEKIYWEANRRLRQSGYSHHLYIATNPDVKSRWLYENIFENPPKNSFVKQLAFKDGWNANDKERKENIWMGSKRQIDLYGLGLWGNPEGAAFLLEEGVHIKPFDATDLDQFYITFDYGFSPDPMVYLLASVKNGIIFIEDEVILTSVPVNRHKAFIEPWFDKYNIVGFTGDTATGSGEIRDLLLSLHILYHPTTKKRSLGWTTLADLIDLLKIVIHPRCKETIKSLASMIWIGSTLGIDCDGDFDDPADAVRYFFMCNTIFTKLGLRQVKPGKITVR